MRRVHLEHIIRAAAGVTGDNEIVVIGSQAILAQVPDPPEELTVSMEADVFPKNLLEMADAIDGALGEFSPFHDEFGYYASTVGPETAVAPEGWMQRLVPLRNENTGDAIGWCLELHDLILAKLAAGRDKDLRYCETAARTGLVDTAKLRTRIPLMTPERADLGRLYGYVERLESLRLKGPLLRGPGL
ncbi:hypothetical protein EPN42_10900 [bacterium]|nr:MAG: hypothetical protein EPN42_10900 [bacterium]